MGQDAVKTADDIVGGRTILKGIFWLWGVVGLVISLVNYQSASQAASVGVGTSAYLTVGILLWIGGFLFFGLAALLAEKKPVALPN